MARAAFPMGLVALVALAALLLAGLAWSHAAKPPPEQEQRLLEDENDDGSTWGGVSGHDLIALDVEEVWVDGHGPRLVFRLVMGGGFTSGDPGGELVDEVKFRMDTLQEFRRVLTTLDDENFSGEFDSIGPKVAENDTGRFSLKLGVDFASIGAQEGDRILNTSSKSYHGAAVRDLMVGGAYTPTGTYIEPTPNEVTEPLARSNLPYTLRGPGYMLGLGAEPASLQISPGASGTINVTVTNRFNATPQDVVVSIVAAPLGWAADFQGSSFALCAACAHVVHVNLTAAADAEPGELQLQAVSSLGGRSTLNVSLALPPPGPAPLEVRDVRIEAGITNATVRWNTTVPADGRVAWGLTPAYGSELHNASLVRAHAFTLEGLAPAATYHLRAASGNGTVNATSDDATFTTRPAPSLAIAAPSAGGTLNGTVAVRVSVADWTGPVDILLDGALLATVDAPYSVAWDTRTSASGVHQLRPRAAGFEGAEVQVTVDNGAPRGQLAQGRVEPVSGDEAQLFTFSVLYTSPEGEPPTSATLLLDGAPRAMAAAAGDVRDGMRYAFATRLGVGQHAYAFTFGTGGGPVRLPASGELQGPSVRAAGTGGALEQGAVEPPLGDIATDFRFSVRYRDPSGAAPAHAALVVDDARYALSVEGRDADGALLLAATATLAVGNHTFHFEATTLAGTVVRFPPTGRLAGPVVVGPAEDHPDGFEARPEPAKQVPAADSLLGALALLGAAVAVRRAGRRA